MDSWLCLSLSQLSVGITFHQDNGDINACFSQWNWTLFVPVKNISLHLSIEKHLIITCLFDWPISLKTTPYSLLLIYPPSLTVRHSPHCTLHPTSSFSRKPKSVPHTNTCSLLLFSPTAHPPLYTPHCICNAACTASCCMGAWFAEGSTSRLHARSHLTDQTSILTTTTTPVSWLSFFQI